MISWNRMEILAVVWFRCCLDSHQSKLVCYGLLLSYTVKRLELFSHFNWSFCSNTKITSVKTINQKMTQQMSLPIFLTKVSKKDLMIQIILRFIPAAFYFSNLLIEKLFNLVILKKWIDQAEEPLALFLITLTISLDYETVTLT